MSGTHPKFPGLAATGCGVASIFSTLCFIDENVNSGKGFDVTDVERFKRTNILNVFKDHVDYFNFAKDKCLNIFYLRNTAQPASGANAYFTAAQAVGAKYEAVIITTDFGRNVKRFDDLKAVRSEYNKDAVIFKTTYGTLWFFCKLH